jgi:uncharacterized membrane protein YbhN (UPF0104 family)
MSTDTASRGRLRQAISLILVVVFLALFVYYVWTRRDSLAELRLAATHMLVLAGVFFLCNVTLRGMFNWVVLRSLSYPVPFLVCFWLSGFTAMTNFLLPMRIGAGFRAGYLKKRYDLPLALFASTLTSLVVLQLFISAGAGLLALGWLTWKGAPFHLSIWLLLGGAFLGTGWAVFLAPDFKRRRGRLMGWLSRVAEGWDATRRNPAVLRGALLATFGTIFFSAASLYAAFEAFDIRASVAGCGLLMTSQVMAGFISLTPGALGFQELLGMYFSLALENTLPEIFAILATMRVVRVAASLLVGLPGLYALTRPAPGARGDAKEKHQA